ncbi:hypothetical protein MesoLjLc_51690 [Mesorhizobium sp. L-8-10]|uniref:hypothetical protein n=1 Tax=Mesorhizobium sp. L-8-10 TaxID=2744523 RepID=UPI001928FC26|nr:hypothetical protein [Mesorhizobium sp. L-8-10]BCH33239.1 hypothetical protein MesoLjLc_51690 [Mesorhizobium sp. L-8-10]
MMATRNLPYLADVHAIEYSELHKDLNAVIEIDGRSVDLSFNLSGWRVKTTLGHWQLNALRRQLDKIAGEMEQLRLMHDLGKGGLFDLRRNAPRPSKFDVFMHPQTAELVYQMQFPDGLAPFAFRISPVELAIIRAKTNSALSRMRN